MMKINRYRVWAIGLLAFLYLAGCQKALPTTTVPASKGQAAKKHDHSHDEGPHDGSIAEWGDHEYHAEFTVDHKTKSVAVYVLDGHAKKAPKLEPGKITKVTLTISNVNPPLTLDLKFDSARTDSKGIAFVGTHDQFGKEMEFQGNISGMIDGKPYSGDFKEAAHDHEHEKKKTHLDGDHPGGVHVVFAQGKYYAEALLHKGGGIHLFLFGKDLAKVVEAETQVITAYVRKIGDKEFTTFELKPEPLPDDEKGYSSRFAGQLPTELHGVPLEIAVPSLKVKGERYHFAFKTVEKGHNEDEAMPAKVEADEEKRLYLEPAGLYTLSDIKANGNMTGSMKFKGFKAAHDLKPKIGDKICPVTLTKANPDCAWIIGGKLYEFCCPPCVDEFVKLAKEEPSAVKPPQEYVKK